MPEETAGDVIRRLLAQQRALARAEATDEDRRLAAELRGKLPALMELPFEEAVKFAQDWCRSQGTDRRRCVMALVVDSPEWKAFIDKFNDAQWQPWLDAQMKEKAAKERAEWFGESSPTPAGEVSTTPPPPLGDANVCGGRP
jgi:hypothetical protein